VAVGDGEKAELDPEGLEERMVLADLVRRDQMGLVAGQPRDAVDVS
jgi:hypothetical protein